METQIHKPSRPSVQALTRDELIHENALFGARINQLEQALRDATEDREIAEIERDRLAQKLEEQPHDESHWICTFDGLTAHVQCWGPAVRRALNAGIDARTLRTKVAAALRTAANQLPLRPKTAA